MCGRRGGYLNQTSELASLRWRQVDSASVVITVSIFDVESLRAVRSLSSFSFSTPQVAG